MTQVRQTYRGAATGTTPRVLMAVVAVVGAQSLLLAPLLPDIAAALRTGPAAIGVASGAYGLATAVSAFAGGRVVDRFPRRLVLRVAAATMAAGMCACAAAPNAAALASGQAVIGLAAGVALPTSYAFAGDIAPAGTETRVLGRVLLGWSIAMVVAVPAAAVLADVIGWRGLFLFLAGLAAGLVALLGALPGHVSGQAARLSYRAAFTRPGVRPLLIVVFAYMAAFYGTYGYLGDEMRTVQGAGASSAGLIAMAYGLGFGAAALLDGIVDRVGPQRLLVPVLILLAGCYGLLPTAAPNLPGLLCLCVAWGLVNHAGLGIVVALLTRRGGDVRGPVMALYSTTTYLATASATASFGLLYQARGLASIAAAALAALIFALVPAFLVRRTTRP